MATIVKALRAVRVPVKVIADFDVLQDKGLLRRLVEALEGDWTKIEKPWAQVSAALNDKWKGPSRDYMREKIAEILDAAPPEGLGRDDSNRIREITKVVTGWEVAKKNGKSAVPSGDSTSRYEELHGLLTNLGLHIVEVGELERFVPTIGSHGPAWVAEVHRSNGHADEEARPAWDFIARVCDVTLPQIRKKSAG